MKAYTDLEQSKKLAEILPIESVNMWYEDCGLMIPRLGSMPKEHTDTEVPCWSLAALLSIIPQELFGGEYIINITEGMNYKWIISYEPPYEVSSYVDASSDNLIDCCVEMIIKLKERNLL